MVIIMINLHEVTETNRMIEQENLEVRLLHLISLFTVLVRI